MQGRLDARMEELMDVAARHKAKDAGTRKKLSLNDLREMEDAGKPRRREIVRDHSHREVQRTRNNSMGKG